MGYVGCVTAACLAETGHMVTGVDLEETKVSLINSGRSPIIEPGLEDLIRRGVDTGRLQALREAKKLGDISLVCVGTPSNENGSLGLGQVERVVGQIGELLRNSDKFHVVVIRSTVLPGTVENIILPLLERTSGKQAGKEFGICMNPEFMRETTAIDDFYHPPFTIIGAHDALSAGRLAAIYSNLECPIERVPIPVAEMIKYASNAFLATKISFINEVAAICERLGADAAVVAQGMGADPRIGPHFLRAGVGFGGSCLPKDLRALVACARVHDVRPLLLEAVQDVNEATRQRFIDTVESALGGLRGRTLAILGLTFKGGTSDLRESPALDIALRLLDGGAVIRAFDPQVGEEITGHLPQAIRCTDAYDAGEGSDAILLLSDCPEFLHLDWRRIASRVRGRLIIDGRGLPVREVATRAGFVYLGRGDRLPVSVP